MKIQVQISWEGQSTGEGGTWPGWWSSSVCWCGRFSWASLLVVLSHGYSVGHNKPLPWRLYVHHAWSRESQLRAVSCVLVLERVSNLCSEGSSFRRKKEHSASCVAVKRTLSPLRGSVLFRLPSCAHPLPTEQFVYLADSLSYWTAMVFSPWLFCAS